jgi:hypothetical protein
MRLSITAMSMAFGILWGACILVVAVANMIWPSYGQAFSSCVHLSIPAIIPAPAWVRSSSERSMLWSTAALAEQSLAGCTTFSFRARWNERP